MRYKRHQKLIVLIFCAIMAAFSIVLDKFLQIPIGKSYKFTLYGLPLMFVGVMFGSLPGLLSGLISGIILQLTSEYGITPTSIFWALAPIAWGGISGLISDIFKRKLNGWIICLIVICSSFGALLLNTFAMFMEGTLMGSEYYTATLILTGLPARLLSCIILCAPYIGILTGLYFALRKLIKSKYELQFEEYIDDELENE